MKKLLLVNPPQPEEELTTRGMKGLNPMHPSLGLMYVASAVREAGYHVEIYDAYLEHHTLEESVRQILARGADLVGLTCWTCNFHRVMKLCDMLKAAGSAPIVLGGPHVTMHPQMCIDDPSVDYVVHGEGEQTIVELMRALERVARGAPRNDQLEQVLGIGYKRDRVGVLNKRRPLIEDLDRLPFPARDLVDLRRYRPAPRHYRTLPSVSIISSRGCPFSCTFCDAIAIWSRSYRQRSVDNVLQEIFQVHDRYGVRDFNFLDSLFGLNKKWVVEFCRRLKAEGPRGLNWTCECRVDTVSEEMLRAMAEAGCWCIFFGIESLEPDSLAAINKKTDIQKIRDAVRWTRKAGIEVRAIFIVGLPHDTPQKARAQLREIKRLHLDFVKFTVLTPYPGTPLHEQIKSGMFGTMTENMSRLTGHSATFLPCGYRSLEEVDEVARWLTRRFYLRPGYVWNRIKRIRSLDELRFYANALRTIVSG